MFRKHSNERNNVYKDSFEVKSGSVSQINSVNEEKELCRQENQNIDIANNKKQTNVFEQCSYDNEDNANDTIERIEERQIRLVNKTMSNGEEERISKETKAKVVSEYDAYLSG